MLEDPGRSEVRRPRSSVIEQLRQRLPLMVVRDRRAEHPPEPLDPITIRVIRWRVEEDKLVLLLLEQFPQALGATPGVDAQIVEHDDRHSSPCPGPLDRAAHLCAEGHRPAATGDRPSEPAVPPVHQPESPLLLVLTRCLDQPLAAPPFAAPDTGEGGMERD